MTLFYRLFTSGRRLPLVQCFLLALVVFMGLQILRMFGGMQDTGHRKLITEMQTTYVQN